MLFLKTFKDAKFTVDCRALQTFFTLFFRRSSFRTFEAFYAREARECMIIDLFLSCTMNHRNFIHRLATQDPPLPLRNNIVLI